MGKIYTEDKLPDPSPTLESNKGVYTGFQLFGRGFPDELKTNSGGDLIVSDGADNYDGFTKVKRPEGYLDFPLYYKLTSQISFSDILTSSDARCHAYPVFDVMKNKSNIYKTTLTGDLLADGSLLYGGKHSIKTIDSLLRDADW